MSWADLASEQAAKWIIALEDGNLSADDRAAFATWLAESDGNKAAYWRLKRSWNDADRIAALGSGEPERQPPPAQRRRTLIPASIAAAIVAMVGWGLHSLQPNTRFEPAVETVSYHSPVGTKTVVNLRDGSTAELNTDTSVRTAVDSARRYVWLDRGEAFFDVERNPDRPFVVDAGTHKVTVLGTKFSVRREDDNVVVAVLEGRVRVDDLSGDNGARSTVISAGDSARLTASTSLVHASSTERIEASLAWREGMLDFDRKSLAAVAHEFNRYNSVRIVIADAEARELQIGGRFPANQPAAFAHLMRDAYGLSVQESAGKIEIGTR